MKTKVTIDLIIEAPDSTSMVSDITILLENIIYKIQDIAPNMADRYTSWQSDAKIIGSVDITPIHESKGAYKIELAQDKQAVDVSEITYEEHNRYYVSAGTITRLDVLGYSVRHPFANEYWPIDVRGKQITTVPCRSSMEGWYWCWMEHVRLQNNTEGLR